MKLLMLGGTFNPIHIAHLMLAEECAWEFGYDTIALVPSYIPPHKIVKDDPGPHERLAMTRHALDSSGQFRYVIDSCEVDREGISYSIDTIDYIRGAYALEAKPGLVIGEDLLAGFSSWKDAERLSESADIIVARRSLNGCERERAAFPYKHSCAHNTFLDISSSDIRSRIRRKMPWKHLVPKGAADYIYMRGLYGNDGVV